MLFNIVTVLLLISLTNHKSCKAKDLFGQGQGLLLKAKAKDLTLKAKAKDLTFKAKDSKFVLKDSSRPRTKAKDNNTGQMSSSFSNCEIVLPGDRST